MPLPYMDDRELIAKIAGRPLIGVGAAYYLAPMRCGQLGCNGIAVYIDMFAPFSIDLNRCRKHAPPPREDRK
jgi:hypothetical protein